VTRLAPFVHAIHPGLAVALAGAGRYEPADRAFAEAMAETASAWAAEAETHGTAAPWPAEAANIVAARRLASRKGWWPLVVRLLDGVTALGVHGGMRQLWHAELLDAAADFVDPDTGEPLPGMEEYGVVLLGHLAWVAEMEGDRARTARLRAADVNHRRTAAANALAVPPERRTEADRALVRRLAVGLTNLGPAQSKMGNPAALDTMTEAIALARQLGDWRLAANNHLNLGVYWMTVPTPPEFDCADKEFTAGYNLAIQDDPPLAGKLMNERGTLHYERALASADPDVVRAELEKAADLLKLAAQLCEPDAVLSHQLGQVHRQLGHLDKARAWFEQAIALRETEPEPGAGADSRLQLALALEDAGLLDEALSFARSAEQVLLQAAEPDRALQLQLEQALARLSLRARA
jgi:tetratricopeptide (TPR) repeat protein